MPIISPATVADAALILALQKQAYESEARLYDDWTIPPLTETCDQFVAEFSDSVVLKATTNEGVLVGAVRGHCANGVCSIGRLIVAPNLQGRGIGSSLLRSIEKNFPQAHTFELFTGSKSYRNIDLYHRHGYVVTNTKALSARVELVFMMKQGRAMN